MPMAGAGGRFAGVASHGRKCGEQRAAAARRSRERRKETERMVSEIMQKYDTDRSGALDKDQVRRLLTDLDHSTPPGTEPSDEEVAFVMQCADSSRNTSIERDELIGAITVWNSYLQDKAKIDEVMKRHDTNASGALDRGQLRSLLTELNEGVEVADEDVDAVMAHADLSNSSDLQRVEILLAVNYWYGRA